MSEPSTFEGTLRRALATQSPGSLCVAYSGGPDSTALLHALAQLPAAHARGLRALHVDHGLHADSTAWAEHCRRFCASLGLPCEIVRVQVETHRGEGLEAAARHARYAAFATHLHAGETLLLAHHRDDQAETVLLKLLRGAGPEGLGGMRERRPLGRGELWRPLLRDTTRAQLHDYAAAHRLPCIDDPSNTDTRLARNRLRHEILPRVATYWPQAVDSILHSATLSRAAADALRTHWLAAFDALHDASGSLDAAGWLALPPALREPLLDHWLHTRGLPAPTTAQRAQIERQCAARPGQSPCIRWPGAELHVWKGRLWAHAPRPAVDPSWQVPWQGEPLALPDGGQLTLHDEHARLTAPLTARLRQGGERIKPAGDAHTRELRDLFQQAALPPWQRLACPLLYEGDALVAVGDRWISARGRQLFAAAGSQPRWQAGA